jgi:hypothetical protein
MMLLAREGDLYRRRAKDLADFAHVDLPDTTEADVARAEKAAAAALAAVAAGTPGERTAKGKTVSAWSAYRDAEVRFFVRSVGPTLGAERVERAERVRLAARRAKESARPSMAP